MQDLADRFIAARRKGWFCSHPILEHCSIPSERDVIALERDMRCLLPTEMRSWLEIVGFCNFADDLSFRPVWFRRVDRGHLNGAVVFGQDTLGNFYAFAPDGSIVLFSRSEPSYAVLGESFRNFLEQLASRDFKVIDWVESITLMPYDWNAA